jgi:hypothetical protein
VVEKNEDLGRVLIEMSKKWDQALISFDEQMLEIEQDSRMTNSPILNEEFKPELVSMVDSYPSPVEENKLEMEKESEKKETSSETSSNHEEEETKKTTPVKKKEKKPDQETGFFWKTFEVGLLVGVPVAISYFLWKKFGKSDEK